MNTSDAINFFIAPIVTGCVIVFILQYFKLPALMKDNTSAIKQLTDEIAIILSKIGASEREIELSRRRHDLTQKILSDTLGHPIDTIKIAEDFGHYPSREVFDSVRTKKVKKPTREQ